MCGALLRVKKALLVSDVCRTDYRKFLTCLLIKRVSRVSILKWPLKHLHVFFKQSAEVLKPQMETRGSVRCFKRSTSVFLSIWVFIHKHSGFTEQQGEREATTISPLYHFQPLQRHLEISQLQRSYHCNTNKVNFIQILQ